MIQIQQIINILAAIGYSFFTLSILGLIISVLFLGFKKMYNIYSNLINIKHILLTILLVSLILVAMKSNIENIMSKKLILSKNKINHYESLLFLLDLILLLARKLFWKQISEFCEKKKLNRFLQTLKFYYVITTMVSFVLNSINTTVFFILLLNI